MQEKVHYTPKTLKENGIIRPNGRYTMNDITENMLVAIEERTGMPPKYQIYGRHPRSLYIEAGEAGHFLRNTLNRVIGKAFKTEEWNKIDDYSGIKAKARQLNDTQTRFLFKLIQTEFEAQNSEDSRSLKAKHLWDSGLTPNMLDEIYAFMFAQDTNPV